MQQLTSVGKLSTPDQDHLQRNLPYGRIYLAGAYTSAAKHSPTTSGPTIGPGSSWRQVLEQTERALQDTGWEVFLPHRDVSRWGDRTLTSADVAIECLSAVASCQAVIAILGESFGTHVEVGVAIGLGIPTVIVRVAGQAESFFGAGLAGSKLVATIELGSAEELPDAILCGDFREAYTDATGALLSQLSDVS